MPFRVLKLLFWLHKEQDLQQCSEKTRSVKASWNPQRGHISFRSVVQRITLNATNIAERATKFSQNRIFYNVRRSDRKRTATRVLCRTGNSPAPDVGLHDQAVQSPKKDTFEKPYFRSVFHIINLFEKHTFEKSQLLVIITIANRLYRGPQRCSCSVELVRIPSLPG